VRLARVEHGPIARPIEAPGTLAAASEHDVSFEIGGKIAQLLVDVGAEVKKGQVLARLDATTITATRTQANEALAKAERDLVRAKQLSLTGAIPGSNVQDAETAVVLARASLVAANEAVAHAALLAPEDGRIDEKLVERGEVVAPGKPIYRLGARGKSIVKIALVDRDVLAVKPGAAAEVRFDADPTRVRPARVRKIATHASPVTGTYEVEVELDADGLPNGLTAKVGIARVETPAAIVPVASLVDGQGTKATVWAIREGRARRVPVEIAFLHDGRAALANALDVEAVVTDGAAQVADDTHVEVLP
jgi:RND family efflux transporter MFP subunit